jgi:hypothetical protein
VEVGEPQRRKFTAIGTDDQSYSPQMVGVPAQGQLAVYDATLERWIPQSGSINSTIQVESALYTASFIDQDPPGLGVAQQITLGAPDTTAYFSVDAAGAITCLQTDEYGVHLRFGIGREGAAGESQIYLRLLVNGVQFGNSAVAIIDNARIEIPAIFEGTLNLTANDVVTLEMIRDTDGDNSGGLRAGSPDVVGWNPSPSASLEFTRFAAVSALETT